MIEEIRKVQIVFQCRFFIRRGGSHALLKAGLVMKVRVLFLGLGVVTGKADSFLGGVCVGKG